VASLPSRSSGATGNSASRGFIDIPFLVGVIDPVDRLFAERSVCFGALAAHSGGFSPGGSLSCF
jgi:hypothetical protein